MAKKTVQDVCDIHLDETAFTPDEAEEIRNLIRRQTPAELKETQEYLARRISYEVKERITRKTQLVANLIKINDHTKEIMTGSKDLRQALSKWYNKLVGRGGMDSQRKSLDITLTSKFYSMESMFETYKNLGTKTLSDVDEASELEKQIYIRMRNIPEQIDPAKLNPKMAQELIKKYGDDDVARLALALKAHNEYTRREMLAAGIAVEFRKDYVLKRRYDYAKLEKMGPQKFAEYMMTKIDVGATFGGQTKEMAMENLIAIYKHLEKAAGERTSLFDFKDFNSNKANSLAQKIVYKDDISAYEAFRDLSVGGLPEQLTHNIKRTASTITSIKNFGYDPKFVIDNVLQNVEKKLGRGRKAADRYLEEKIRQAQKELSGQQHLTTTAITDFATAAKTYTSIAKLGNVLPTAMMDAIDNNRQVFYHNGQLFGGVLEWGKSFAKIATMDTEGKKKVAENLNVLFQFISNGQGMRMAEGDLATSGSNVAEFIAKNGAKAMNLATLLPWQTGISKLSTAVVANNTVSGIFTKFSKGETLNAFEADTLKELKFSENEARLLGSDKIKKIELWSGKEMITGKSIRDSLLEIPEPELAKLLDVPEDLAYRTAMNMADKYDVAITDFVTRGTPAPELRTKVAMLKGHDSEATRAAIGLLTQFLDTPISQLQNFYELSKKLQRLHDGKNGFELGSGAALNLAMYLGSGISIYLAADYVSSMVTNKEAVVQKLQRVDDQERRAMMLNLIGRTSAIPFAAEVLEKQMYGRYNETALNIIGGPSVSMFTDALRMLKPDEAGGMSLVDFASKSLPMNSIPARFIMNWGAQASREGLPVPDEIDRQQETFLGR